MSPIVKKTMVIGALCLTGATGTAYAGFSDVLEAKIPFPFVVGDRTLPAGEYLIERDDYMSGTLIIRGEHGTNASAVLNTRPAAGHAPGGTRPTLQFKHVENEYRLSNVWAGDGLDRAVK